MNESERLAAEMAMGGGAVSAEDPIELEEKYHDTNAFVSVAVIEHESKYLTLLMEMYRNSPDELAFFEFRKESLDFAKESIEGDIGAGVITPESYTDNIKSFLAATKRLHQEAQSSLGASNEHTQRLKKRI